MKNIRVIVSAVVLGILLLIVIGASALATGGPHEGTFTTTTDACAGCHRIHTAPASKLLKTGPSQWSLCVSCHDGTGANTKVTTGVYLGSTNGTQNAGLKGGGFLQALMNAGLSGTFNPTGTPNDITSRHSVNGTSLIVWGSNTSDIEGDIASSLVCGNCHNPHGNTYYRMLRPQPTALSWYSSLGLVGVNGSGNETYTISYTANETRDLNIYGGNITSGIGDWCAQCHTVYLAGVNSGTTNSTYGMYQFRHMTNTLNGECFRCHVAHGTSANATGWASSLNISWPDGNTTQAWQTATENTQNASRLLSVNNRGVCLQCHTSASLTQN